MMSQQDEITEQIAQFYKNGGEIEVLPSQPKPKRRYLINDPYKVANAIEAARGKPLTFKDHFYSKGTVWLLEQRGMFYRQSDDSNLGHNNKSLYRNCPSKNEENAFILSFEAIEVLDGAISSIQKLYPNEVKAMELFYKGEEGRNGSKPLSQNQIGRNLGIPQRSVSDRISLGVAYLSGWLLLHFRDNSF